MLLSSSLETVSRTPVVGNSPASPRCLCVLYISLFVMESSIHFFLTYWFLGGLPPVSLSCFCPVSFCLSASCANFTDLFESVNIWHVYN